MTSNKRLITTRYNSILDINCDKITINKYNEWIKRFDHIMSKIISITLDFDYSFIHKNNNIDLIIKLEKPKNILIKLFERHIEFIAKKQQENIIQYIVKDNNKLYHFNLIFRTC